VARDPPEGLLELGRGEEEPAMHARALGEVVGKEPPLRILLGQVLRDGHRLGESEVAVHQHGEPAGGVDPEELGPAVLAGDQVHRHGLEVDAELLQRPARADRTGGTELV
jgi:hypothetical protein